ncbi:hypothetical protein Tco_0117532 [Tanacetum coccineum]
MMKQEKLRNSGGASIERCCCLVAGKQTLLRCLWGRVATTFQGPWFVLLMRIEVLARGVSSLRLLFALYGECPVVTRVPSRRVGMPSTRAIWAHNPLARDARPLAVLAVLGDMCMWDALQFPSNERVSNILGHDKELDDQIYPYGPKKSKLSESDARKRSFVCNPIHISYNPYSVVRSIIQRDLHDRWIELRNDGALYYLDQIWVPLKGDYWWPGMMESGYSWKYVSRCLTCIDLKVKVWHHKRPSWHAPAYPEIPYGKWEGIVMDYMTKFSGLVGGMTHRKKGKLAPRFVGPFEIIEKVGPVAYRLDLPEELNGVHDTFHVSNLKKCLADPTLKVPLDEIQVDAKLNFVEEPIEILEREFKKLKHSRNAVVKVRWNLKYGPEFTWEREDQMKLKYSHLFSDVRYMNFLGDKNFC